MKLKAFAAVLACATLIGLAQPADAAAVRVGATLAAIIAGTRGSAVAYDSISKVYLVVSAYGTVRGRFISSDGTPLGTQFVIQSSGNYTHFPRVAFSPDADGGAGAFLVTWNETDLPLEHTSVHVRLVSYSRDGAFGTETRISSIASMFESGPSVAYATGSKEFLVAYHERFGTTNDIVAVRVSNTATMLAPGIELTLDSQYQRDPSVAYNPQTDEFMVVWAGYYDPGQFAFVDSRRIKAGSGAMLGSAVRLAQAGGTYITDVTYNPATNQFLASWFSTPGQAEFGRLLNADGSIASGILTLSTRWKAYDALSIAYNQTTDTFMMVSHSGTVEDGGVELSTNGVPVDNGGLVTAAGGALGNFHPRIAAAADRPEWLMSTGHDFASTLVQRIGGTAITAPPPVPNPAMSIDTPRDGVVQQPFVLAGWGLDRGASSGSGADTIHVWAWPVAGGAPIFAGIANYGWARPDVGNAFGSQFTNSGYGLIVNNLPAGTYTLVAYLHSTVAGTFNLSRAVTVTIADPQMSLDTPGQGATKPASGFNVGGWAIDRGAATGTGVDTLHVWAFPVSGGAPSFAGVAIYGASRPDVGAVFGAQFTNSGYNLTVRDLTPGTYDIIVFSHSTVTGSFNAARVVRVTVQ